MLDVGAGSGVFARQLLAAGVCDRAVCVDPNYVEERIEQAQGKEIEFRRSVDDVTQQLILMIDVLEHVDNDQTLLQSYIERAPRSASVLISVPAFQFLWSGHDVFLEHRRRYTRAQVEALVRRAGLEVVRSRYFFAILFPLVALHAAPRPPAAAKWSGGGAECLDPAAPPGQRRAHRIAFARAGQPLAHQPAGRPVGALPRAATLGLRSAKAQNRLIRNSATGVTVTISRMAQA